MPKRLIKRFTPDPDKLKNHPQLKFFGNKLHNPNLWLINRRSTAGAVAIGLFCAWMPIPFQMVVASILAMIFSMNLPLSVALVWLSNPISMPPLFYGAYRLGAWILSEPVMDFSFELSFEWIIKTLDTIAPSLVLGSLILGIISSVMGYSLVRVLWRIKMANKWKNRSKRL